MVRVQCRSGVLAQPREPCGMQVNQADRSYLPESTGLASPDPPPTRAASELVVWRDERGPAFSGAPGANRPATECTAMTSEARFSRSDAERADINAAYGLGRHRMAQL